jgi:glycosyl-4,4'-diaponeurosporenoate acyltransferase
MRAVAFAVASLCLVGLLVLLGVSTRVGPIVHAMLVNLVVVGWAAFVLPLRGLPRFDEYYTLRDWERSGRVFHWLGVPLFRALVRRGPLSLSNRALPAAWHSGDPARIERETRAAEGGHAIAFLIVLLLALVALARGAPERAAWLVVLDIPMNLYPVLLQRDHRHRLQVMLRAGELVQGSPVSPDKRHDTTT